MFDKFKRIFERENVTIQKFKPFFITIDGVEHEGRNYNWCISDRISCTVPEYLMISIRSDKYIEDKNEVMYMLTNIISVRWELVGEKVVEDNFDRYRCFVTTKELEEAMKR